MGVRPRLVIVTGPAASGKSAIAASIAGHYRLPLFSKDAIKEALFDSLGWSDRDWSKRLGLATYSIPFGIVESELAAGRSLVIESNFRRDEASPIFNEIKARHEFRPIQVLCVCDNDVRLGRYMDRRRHPGHVDDVVIREMTSAPSPSDDLPLDIGGELITIDTNDFQAIDFGSIYERLDALL